MEIKGNQIIASDGKYVHRIGQDAYFKKGFILKDETIDSFEEVDNIPEISSIDYNEEVNNLIRQKYSLSEELAILRQRDTKPEEFSEYNTYAEECKAKVKLLMNK